MVRTSEQTRFGGSVPVLRTIPLSVLLLGSLISARATESTDASQRIIVSRSGSHPFRNTPGEYFTGSVRLEPLFEASGSAETSASTSPSSRALDNGLSQAEASEMLTHLLFYAGW